MKDTYNIVNTILKHKDKIKYKGYTFPDMGTGGYHTFKFYFGTRNIFGMKKYLKIICWDDFDQYKAGDILDINIEIPSWNIFKCDDNISINSETLSAELKRVRDKYLHDDTCKSCNHIKKILDDNLKKKK